jgi:hypothetical protein
MKAVFDGVVDYELGKEYYEEIVRLLKQDILSESDLELHNQLYNEISDEIVNGKDFDEKHTVLYKMVYPLFTYNTVTYDKDKQSESLVQSTSRIYKSLK